MSPPLHFTQIYQFKYKGKGSPQCLLLSWGYQAPLGEPVGVVKPGTGVWGADLSPFSPVFSYIGHDLLKSF